MAPYTVVAATSEQKGMKRKAVEEGEGTKPKMAKMDDQKDKAQKTKKVHPLVAALAEKLKALPPKPTREHITPLLEDGLPAKLLCYAENYLGREMNRVDAIWWKLIVRDFGKPKYSFTCGIRELYKKIDAKNKQKKEEQKKKIAESMENAFPCFFSTSATERI